MLNILAEQKFRRIRVCPKVKYLKKAPTKNWPKSIISLAYAHSFEQ